MIEFVDAVAARAGRPARPGPRADHVAPGLTLRLGPGPLHLLLGREDGEQDALVAACHGGAALASGEVRTFGAAVCPGDRRGRAALRRRVGVVEARARLVSGLTLAENVAVPLIAAGEDPAGREEDVAALLHWVGLRAEAEARPEDASLAARQRAALARAVILSPEAIVATDPAAGLGREAALHLLGRFAELAAMGRTVLVALADPALARALGETAEVKVHRLPAAALEAAA